MDQGIWIACTPKYLKVRVSGWRTKQNLMRRAIIKKRPWEPLNKRQGCGKSFKPKRTVNPISPMCLSFGYPFVGVYVDMKDAEKDHSYQ